MWLKALVHVKRIHRLPHLSRLGVLTQLARHWSKENSVSSYLRPQQSVGVVAAAVVVSQLRLPIDYNHKKLVGISTSKLSPSGQRQS